MSKHASENCLMTAKLADNLYFAHEPPEVNELLYIYRQICDRQNEINYFSELILKLARPREITRERQTPLALLRKDFDANGTTFEWNRLTQRWEKVMSYDNILEENLFIMTPPPSPTVIASPQPPRTPTIQTKPPVKERFKSKTVEVASFCVFCQNNGEPEAVYKSHSVRDKNNRTTCSRLRNYKCPICGATGDKAHTVKYCPDKPILTMDDVDRLAHKGCHGKHKNNRN